MKSSMVNCLDFGIVIVVIEVSSCVIWKLVEGVI